MTKKVPSTNLQASTQVVHDIRHLIKEARSLVAVTVNAALTTLYWQIGKRINEEILKGERAEYGALILPTLSAKLVLDYGDGFSAKNLRHMIRFATVYPDEEIVSALRRQLTWTHLRAVIYLEDPLKRDFYAEMCRIEKWSTRTLQNRIDSMLYERTALSRKPEELIRLELKTLRDEDRLTPGLVFRDPYFLDFLGLKDRYLEKDLEDAILREMEKFLLEMGAGFTFVARQKRMQIDNDDFYLDLLFYNRKLKRLVAVELKLGDFRHEHKSQMELYLRWLAKYEREPDEQMPLGIILCSGKKREQIELLELNQSGIHVAEYLTELPPREMLERKLHAAIAHARLQYEDRDMMQEEENASTKNNGTVRPVKKGKP